MRFNLLRVVLIILICSAWGCAYSKIRVPLDTDVNRTELGQKEGRASTHSLLWLFAWGDSSTAAAAENGDLKVINHLDRELHSYVFGLYARHTTIAYGD